jgi:hypothetical protein
VSLFHRGVALSEDALALGSQFHHLVSHTAQRRCRQLSCPTNDQRLHGDSACVKKSGKDLITELRHALGDNERYIRWEGVEEWAPNEEKVSAAPGGQAWYWDSQALCGNMAYGRPQAVVIEKTQLPRGAEFVKECSLAGE